MLQQQPWISMCACVGGWRGGGASLQYNNLFHSKGQEGKPNSLLNAIRALAILLICLFTVALQA